jgi:cob(I)alamin adenosyltransferase
MVNKGTPPLVVEKLEPKVRKGLIVVVTGNGKGKTTAALGMMVRAVGHGMKVCMIQFMKGDLYAGEWDGVKSLPGVELHTTGKGFCGIRGNPYPWKEHRANAQDAIRLAQEKITSHKYDLVILDEINNAQSLKLVDLEQVLKLMALKPPQVHLVLTGRDAHAEVVELADTVSEVHEIKHPYRQKIEPQPGIDY